MASVFSRRIVAYIIDFFVISAVMWIISLLVSFVVAPIDLSSYYAPFPFIAPILGFIYFVVLEKAKGATVGKALMYLEVRSLNGSNISLAQAIVRNLTKIYWIPIIFDWLIGRIMNSDRLFNKITRTVVVNAIN
ncbi:RDD family protein [Methanobrevibacter sp.]|uniref:RDD family protein n=1 Tax=Methanobrevibacter sp. TaxID=66852 RepID=UPI00388E5676